MTQISAGFHSRLRIAPLANRFLAYLLDGIILTAAGWLFVAAEAVISATASAILFILLLDLLWPVVWLRHRCATPGKLLTRLRVQPTPGPGPLTWSMALRREVVRMLPTIGITVGITLLDPTPDPTGPLAWAALALCLLWFFVDNLWAFTNPQRQTLHDKAAGTVVVQTVKMWGPAPHPAPGPGGAMPSTAPPAPPSPGR